MPCGRRLVGTRAESTPITTSTSVTATRRRELEEAWLREYVDNPHGHDVRAVATSSGMAAFTTILGCLLMEPGPQRPVLVGASTYHECREHLGTNLTDLAAHQIPEPNRPLLQARLARLGRNARELAAFLAERHDRRGLPVRVDHPGLPGHPSFPAARTLSFQGGTFGLTPEVDTHELRAQLVKAILYEARRRRVPLVEGTSFGFDATRVYLTASGNAHGLPFVRVAAGSEHRLGVEALKRVLLAAVEGQR